MHLMNPLRAALAATLAGLAPVVALAELSGPTPKYIHGGADAWPSDVPFPADSRWGNPGAISKPDDSPPVPTSPVIPQGEALQKTKFTPNDVRSVPAHTRLAYYARVNEAGDTIYLCYVHHGLVPHRWFERDIAKFCEPGVQDKTIEAEPSGRLGTMWYHGEFTKIYVDAQKRIRLMMTEGSPDAVYAVPAVFQANGEWEIQKTSYGRVKRALLLGLVKEEP